MNKRIISLVLCFLMVFTMSAAAAPAAAATVESTQLKVTPDKTTASPGDTITYSITLGPVSDMGTMQMDLVIPAGLSYVENSGKLADNLKATLGFDDAAWTEVTKRITGAASAADYESAVDTPLATFKCKVTDDAAGTLTVGLDNLEFYSCQTWEDHTSRYSVAATPVTVTAAPKPATGISINKGATTIYTGESEKLYATVTPLDSTDTVTWESSKTSVATVDNTGNVTAVAPGTATITAKAGSKTATCNVTVEDAPCVHTNKDSITEKDSTCKDRGWDAYQKCSDCGQLFDQSGNAIDEIPYRPLSTTHVEGTPATCKDRAVCSICGQPYGDLAAHNYEKQAKTMEALKSEGNCAVEEEYYYSCTVCDAVERNAAHTFKGDKVPDTHTGNTELRGEKAPDHKNQIAGYTGDTHCKDCGEKLADGKEIPAGEHIPGTDWQTSDTEHWKVCSVEGCGVVIESTKASHVHTEEWKKDVNNHWHECECGHKADEAAHRSSGPATEETAEICLDCGYEIAPMLGHTCAVERTVTANAPSCTEAGNTAYYECKCGKWYSDDECKNEITDKESVTLPALGHIYEEKLEDEAHLKETGANCQQYNTYWYDCTRVGCDSNAKNDSSATDKFFTSKTNTGAHSYDEANWGYRENDGHAHKCIYCDAHETPLIHQDDGWQYDFPNKEKFKVCKDCGYEMERIALANFSVSFNANGGSGSMTSITVLEGTEFTFPENGFTAPDDQVFTGWSNGPQTYKPGEKITPYGDLRFDAQWTPKTQHSHAYDSDYKADALNHWKECVCGAKDTPTAHDFGAWNTTKEPTTSAKGEKERYCNTCKYKETAEIDKLSDGSSSDNSSHRHVYDSDYKADALNHWKECACGAKDTPTAHDFGAWNTTKEPTTSAKGEKERYCNTCKYKETAEIDKLSGGQSQTPSSGGSSSDNSSSGSTQITAKVTPVSPQTGDNANIFVWMMALVISVAGICGVTVYARKRRSVK